MRLIAIAGLIAGTLMIAPTASGQEQSGRIEGRVIIPEEEPLEDAAVVLSGPALQGLRTELTDNSGHFRFAAVPVGRYRIVVRHAAYRGLQLDSISVRLGETTNLGTQRVYRAIVEQEPIVVVGRADLVDPAASDLSRTLPKSTIDGVPTDRNFRSLVALVPEVGTNTAGEEPNVAGHTSEGNLYFIDGTDVSDPVGVGGSTQLPYNFIRELEVKTGGYEAEYGRAYGGLVNAITQSGSDIVHGQVFGYFTNQGLRAESENPLLSPNPGDFSAYDFGGSIGGPIIRERLWYFAAYNPSFDRRQVEVPGLSPEDAPTTTHRLAGKLSWQANRATHLDLTVLGDPSEGTRVGVPFGLASPPASVLNRDAVVADTQNGGVNVSLQGLHRASEKLLLQAGLSRAKNKAYVLPVSDVGRTEAFLSDLESNTASGGYGGENLNSQERFAGRAGATWFLGFHEPKVGFEYTDNSIENNIQFGAGKAHAGFLYRANDSTWTWLQGYSLGEVHSRVWTAFAQDSWRVTGSWRLNLGLRWDGSWYEDNEGNRALEFPDCWQPRLGFVYQIGEAASQRVFGSLGRFYEVLPAGSPGYYFFDSVQLFMGFDHDPRIDPSGGDTTALLPNPPGTEGLDAQHYDEAVLGYERELPGQLKLGVRAHYRVLRAVVEDSYSEAAGLYLIGNPGHGVLSYLPEARQEYESLQLTIERSGRGPIDFLASYVLSKNWGNYAGLISGNGGPQFDFAESMENSTGLLPNDRVHQFKLHGTYRIGANTSVGGSFVWQSGSPLSEIGAIAGLPFPRYLSQRGTVGRCPDLYDLNLRLSQGGISLGERLRGSLLLDLFHVFDPQDAISLDERHYLGEDASGNQIEENPNYLQPTALQSPFAARLGLVVEF